MSNPAPRYSAKTDVGLVRKLNEDAIVARPEIGLWAVADGMGGHEAGDLASQTIIEHLQMLSDRLGPGELLKGARGAVQDAHAKLRRESERRGGAMLGSTVVVLILTGGHFACLWAGDSRLYLLRDGQLEMITMDHSLVADLVASGDLTWAEAEKHPQANVITRAVGAVEHLELDKRHGEIKPGDRFLICSDGLSRYADESAITAILSAGAVEEISDQMIQLALEGGGADNISAVAIEIPGGSPAMASAYIPPMAEEEDATLPPGGAPPPVDPLAGGPLLGGHDDGGDGQSGGHGDDHKDGGGDILDEIFGKDPL